MTAGGRVAAFGHAAVLTAIALGSCLLILAMARYPGGTALNPVSAGHSFWFNFLCDLTNDVAVNGRPNREGAVFAQMALGAFCVALLVFWITLPASFPSCPPRLSAGIRVCGVLSVAGLLAVPVAGGLLHVAAVFTSFVPALIAGLLALVGTVRYARSRALVAIASATVSVSVLDSVLYARSYLIHPRVVVPALPLLQRLALLLMLAWMAIVAGRALWFLRTEGRGGPRVTR